MKGVEDCKDIATKYKRVLIKDIDTSRVLVRGSSGKKDGTAILYVKRVTEWLREHVEF